MPESQVIPELAYEDVTEAVEWLCEAFGFKERMRIGDHRAQLTFEQDSVIVTQLNPGRGAGPTARNSPPSKFQDSRTHSVMVRVKDVDRHYNQAVQHGVRILHAPADYPYGERQYTAEDIGGHVWTFSQTIADVDPTLWGGRLSDSA